MFKRTNKALRAGGALAFLCIAAVSAQAADRTGSIGDVDTDTAALPVMAPRDTLTADDLAADWHLPPTP